jgi:hypothetical protein
MNKKISILSVFFLVAINAFVATAQNSCLPGGIAFTNQEQIDSFPDQYPGCNDVLGPVLIQGSNINNLSGLLQINMIRQDLQITNTSMLVSLEGLNNLWFIGTGIDQLYGLNITGNTGLTSLQGLNSLAELTGALQIASNHLLLDLDGLENLETTAGFVLLFNNGSLSDITGLRKLSVIGGSLMIDNLPALQSLKGIDNIDPFSIAGLRIKSSGNLIYCHVSSICGYLASGGIADIRLNGFGCENRETVENGCLSTHEPEILNEPRCIFPNPSDGTFRIKGDCAEYGTEIEIVNMSGMVIERVTIDSDQQVVLKGVAKGTYFVRMLNSKINKHLLLMIQ